MINTDKSVKIKLKEDFKPVYTEKYFGKLPNDLYPYWYWELTDYKGNTFDFYPSWESLLKILKETFAHEKRLDIIMERNSEFQKWFNFATQVIDIAKNNKILEK